MKFDDGEYYFLNATTEGFTWEAANTHIGMYVAWLIERSLFGDSADAGAVAKVRSRAITGAQFVEDQCDCKLIDEDLNEDGLAFTSWYYEQYMKEYCRHFRLDGSADSLAKVANSWDNYDQLRPILDRAYARWRREVSPPSVCRIHLWRHPSLWRWPTKYDDAERMFKALQGKPAVEKKSLTRFVDALAAVDLSHDWSQLERSATLVSSLSLNLKDRKPLDALIATARRLGFSLHVEEHSTFYFPNGHVVIQGEPQRFRNYVNPGNTGIKTRPSGIASMHELCDIVCARWAPVLARYGFTLDPDYKKGTDIYTERRFVADGPTTRCRVDVYAYDRVDNNNCEHPYEMSVDLFLCFKEIAMMRQKAHYDDAIPNDAQLPSTAFIRQAQWLSDPHGLKTEIEDYLAIRDLQGLERVIDATAEQLNTRLPELLNCFKDIHTLERALNTDPIEFSIFYPGSASTCANHVVAAYLARSPRYVQICDYLMQSIANAQPVKAGQAVGGWLRDMDEANIRHLHKCIQYTARLYGSEIEGK